MLALLSLFSLLFIDLATQKCVGIDTINTQLCSYCAFDYYFFPEFYNGNSYSDNSFFSVAKCVPKNNSRNNIKIEIFIGNSTCNLSACLGTRDSPMPNIIQGLVKATELARDHSGGSVDIILINSEYYILDTDYPSKTENIIHFLRHCNVEISIRPDKGRSLINIKTFRLILFVSTKLNISDIDFEGSDINLPVTDSCRLNTKQCCYFDNKTRTFIPNGAGSCGEYKNYSEPEKSQAFRGLFNTEYIFDKNSAQRIPELILLRVRIMNFYALDLKKSYGSLISSENGLPANISLLNCEIRNVFFPSGLLSIQLFKAINFILISEAGETSLIFSIPSIDIPQSIVIIQDIIFDSFNIINVIPDKIIVPTFFGVFSLSGIQFKLLIRNCSFTKILTLSNPLIFLSGSTGDMNSLEMVNNNYEDNKMLALLNIQNVPDARLSGNVFIYNAFLENIARVFQGKINFYNESHFYNYFGGANIYLIDGVSLNFENFVMIETISKATGSYLILCHSPLSTSFENLRNNYDTSKIEYSKDRVYIKSSVFQNLNFLLLKTIDSVFEIHINGSKFIDLHPREDDPLFQVTIEKQILLVNTTFRAIDTKNNIITASSSKNLTFINCTISDSQFYNGFDYLVVSQIRSEAYKIRFNLTNTRFFNLTLRRFQNTPVKFIYFLPYSPEYGVEMLFLRDSVFKDIYCEDCDTQDFFFLIGVQRIYFENTTFSNLDKLSVTRIYLRYHWESTLHLINCNYSFPNSTVHLIILITSEYFLQEGYIINSNFEASKPMEGSNALTFLHSKKFTIKGSTFKNINNKIGNVLTLKVEQLDYFLIENCYFLNNSGNNQVAADVKIECELPINIDWSSSEYLQEDPGFGILNSVFKSSSFTGSISISKNTEMLIKNCSFFEPFSADGGTIEFKRGSNVLMKEVNITGSRALRKGGSFFLFQSKVLFQNVVINNSSSKEFGGIITSMSSVIIIRGSLFQSSNTETLGGLLWADSSDIMIENSILKNNTAELQGGQLYFKDSLIQIRNSSLIGGNSISASAIYSAGFILKLYFVNISDARSSDEDGLGTLFFWYSDVTIEGLRCEKNRARAGACIFSQDSRVLISKSFIKGNHAVVGDIFQTNFFDELTSLQIYSTSFDENIASKGIISSTLTKTDIVSCSMNNNRVSEYYVSGIGNALQILKSTFVYKNNIIVSVTLIKAVKIELFEISDCFLNGGYSISLLSAEQTKNFYSNKTNYTKGCSQRTGAGISLISSRNKIENAIFDSNIAGTEGAAIYLWDSALVLSYSIFFSNVAKVKGSDIVSDSTQLPSEFGLVINSCIFQNYSTYSSLQARFSKIKVYNSFYKNANNDSISVVSLSEFVIIDIINSSFQEASTNAYILTANSYNNFSIITLSQCVFIKKFRIIQPDVLFIASKGNVKININNSRFDSHFLYREDAYISYVCSLPECELKMDGSVNLTDLGQENKKGHFIYSPSFEIFVGGGVRFVSDRSFPYIYSIPNKILITQNTEILMKDDLELIERSIIDDIQSKQKDYIISRSGKEFDLGLVIVDSQGNIQASQNDRNIDMFPIIDDDRVYLEASPCQIMKGKCVFQKISLTAPSNNFYIFQIKFNHEDGFIVTNLKIYLESCLKGEIVYNQMCFNCLENFYSLQLNTNKTTATVCKRCPDSAKCPGGSKIIPEEGYWRLNENNSAVIACKFESACPYQKQWEDKNYSEALLFDCGTGYHGNLCQECEVGYGLVNDSGCYECATNHLNSFINSLKIILVLFFIAWDCHTSLSTNISDHKTLLKILVSHTNYMIAVTSMRLDLAGEFKNIFSIMNNFLSTMPADIFNFHCFIKGFVTQDQLFAVNNAIRLVCIFIYTVLVYLLKVLIDLYLLIKHKQPILETLKSDFSNTILLTFLIVFRNMYPRVLQSLLTIIKCVDLGDDQAFMEDNPNVECHGPEHMKYIGSLSIIGMLLWSLTVPALLFKYMHKRKDFLIKQNLNIKNLKNSSSIKTKNSVSLNGKTV